MGKKVLVVDDEKLIVKGIRFSLEQDNMEVDCAYDGEEALKYVKNNEYDLILLDVMLPKFSGFEVCQQIREFSNVPIIMLTAKGEDMDKILRERRSYIANAAEGGDVIPLTSTREEGVTAQVIVPIVSGGDCLGAVAVLSKEEGAKMDGSDMNLARLTADILANQFE